MKLKTRHISILTPYIAVLVGLYLAKNAWLAIGLYHLGITAFLIFDKQNGLLGTIFKGWCSLAAALSVIMSATILPIFFLFWKYLHLEDIALKDTLADFGLNGISWIIFMIYFSTVQPFLEELFWRGYLKSDKKLFSPIDLAFAGYHVLVLAWFIKAPYLIMAFAAVALAGFIWRNTYQKLNGLAVPLTSHSAADISIIIVVHILAFSS